MNRILVIRGGAIGDFILILPALKALRDANPKAQIDILGYKHIAELAHQRFYADGVRSIEYAPLSRFFAKNAELPPDLVDYFASFDLVISYLYDPDQILENNLRRSGVQQLVAGPARIGEHEHASRQLAKPVEELGLRVETLAAQVYPSPEDRQFARDFLEDSASPVIVFHPGSGSEKKNWPLQNWIDLGSGLLGSPHFRGTLIVVCGEADQARMERLKAIWRNPRTRFAENLSLPQLAALFENTIFVGHDSGISHLAAAAGARCVLLFGPTNPDVWAPMSEKVEVIQAARGNLSAVDVTTVREAMKL